MILSTQTHAAAVAFGLETAVNMIADAGFDALDLSMFYEDSSKWMFEPGFEPRILRAKQIASARGLPCQFRAEGFSESEAGNAMEVAGGAAACQIGVPARGVGSARAMVTYDGCEETARLLAAVIEEGIEPCGERIK